jgi:thiamine biosynthesis lipoprotein
MACEFELFLNAGQHEAAVETALGAFDLLETLEAQLTVYRETSELLEINRTAAAGSVGVEPRLFALLELAQGLYRATGGAYDITSGPLSKVWGFSRRAGAIPDQATLDEALAHVGGEAVELDATRQTVRFTRPGVELNLGSIGKGYALDRCQELMTAGGVANFLWHGGQSSVLARGSAAGAPAGSGWTVGLRHPLRDERRLAEIRLVDQALSTSGSGVQFFRHQGKRYGHILDPRTGWPAEGMFSSTVIAPTAAEADALSTAFYVLGVERTLEYCEGRPEIGVILLYPSASGSTIELACANLDDERWKLME